MTGSGILSRIAFASVALNQHTRWRRTSLAVVRLDLISFTPLKSLPAHLDHLEATACGKIVGIFGWSTARTIGSTLGRICFSGIESHLPRQTQSPLVRLSIAGFGPAAMSAARNICISPQKSSDSSKSLLSHSLHIRYFVMKEVAPIQLSREGRAKKLEGEWDRLLNWLETQSAK
jgi:hypothetical protein